MKQVKLSEEEISLLKLEAKNSLAYRNRQLKKLLTWLAIGTVGACGLLIYKDSSAILGKIFGTLIVGLFMGLNMLLFWKLARRSITKLERDVEQGVKIVGSSAIKFKSPLNQKIKLEDTTVIWTSHVIADTVTKGDIIDYEITPSGEYLFDCKKNAAQQSV